MPRKRKIVMYSPIINGPVEFTESKVKGTLFPEALERVNKMLARAVLIKREPRQSRGS